MRGREIDTERERERYNERELRAREIRGGGRESYRERERYNERERVREREIQ